MIGKIFEKENGEMIDPRTQYIIHKEKENKLMLQIERKLAAQEGSKIEETSHSLYSTVKQWFNEKVFSFRPVKSPCPPEEEPC